MWSFKCPHQLDKKRLICTNYHHEDLGSKNELNLFYNNPVHLIIKMGLFQRLKVESMLFIITMRLTIHVIIPIIDNSLHFLACLFSI